MKIVITGSSGVVGSSFLRFFPDSEHTIFTPTHKEVDITNSVSVNKYLKKVRPDVVIHFAAFRDAAKAEFERGDKNGLVWKTNVTGTRNITRYSKKNNIYLIYISTDMVFSGHKSNPGPYSEKQNPEKRKSKLSWYGITKREGERIVSTQKNTAVIRIGNVTMDSTDPKFDYIGKILWLFENKKMYPIFNDQYLTLSYIPHMTLLITQLIENKKNGVFHVASHDLFTPFELAKYLIRKINPMATGIEHASILKYLEKNPNRYPQFGGLDSRVTHRKFKLPMLSWKEIATMYMKNVKQKKYEK